MAAWTGIAATLLKIGKTIHSIFNLPVPLTENSVCNVTPDSEHATELSVSKNIRLSRIPRDQNYISSILNAAKFSEIEQGKILALKVKGMSNVKIDVKVRRSRKPVENFLKDLDGYNRVRAGRRPKAASETDERAIVSVMEKSHCYSVSKIKASAGVEASKDE
ncbi:ATP-dependent DNA helicase pif1-like [Octopus vulgaris]|uniref:ATP-dependent DNA helicase n=1 Tax=Octopus vulgaris TaxID=6645 RepID=A0AA36BXL8_OCTVU|nr:ATP-dependent DNA helicase pif1-like [Octopus vulgaris]